MLSMTRPASPIAAAPTSSQALLQAQFGRLGDNTLHGLTQYTSHILTWSSKKTEAYVVVLSGCLPMFPTTMAGTFKVMAQSPSNLAAEWQAQLYHT